MSLNNSELREAHSSFSVSLDSPSICIGALVSVCKNPDESPSSSISEWRCVAYITHKSDSKPTKNPTCARATGPQFSSGRRELRYLCKREREAESENCETKTKTYLSSGKCQQTSCAPNCQFEFNFGVEWKTEIALEN